MVPTEQKLLNILSNNNVTFFIPPYQRNYEWTKDQCEVFLEDVIKTYEANFNNIRSEHFFGTITYFQTESVFGQPNKLVLIDGQQRITTTMLFLIAVRNLTKDENIKSFINIHYLKNENVKGETEYKIKLKQVETDWTAFKKIVLEEHLTDTEKDSAIFSNYKYFYNKLIELEKEGISFNELIEKGLNKFSLITIQLEPDRNPWENPQEIFESMNSLGKPLSFADLVRNYIFLGLRPEEQERLYRKYWLYIETIIPGQVSNFIRDYMQAYEHKPFVKATEHNSKALYAAFKKIFNFKNDSPELLLEDFIENALLYSYIINGKGTGEALIDRELEDLNMMSVTTAHSLVMALLQEWKKKRITTNELKDILYAFKIYIMRRRLIGITSAENQTFPVLTGMIDSIVMAKDKQYEMFCILSNLDNSMRLPNDIELKRYLETMNFYNFKYSKLYLALIEETITNVRPNLMSPFLTIEHIMPIALNSQWRNELGINADETHQELLNTIGNLTLINHIPELGNKSFKDKTDYYKYRESLQIAKLHIINNVHWNSQAIHTRAEWIINYILQNVLPVPDSMRRTNNYKPKEERRLSFEELQLIGETINFIGDPNITARIIGDTYVEFEGKKWKLSPLTKEIQTRKGNVNNSGSYSGSNYWEYDGMKLSDIF